ncbi:hypothetical protein KC354_g140 [Hortaea werneckii]|nr:hypothetical protein KC354_g140 [Hortaea werneckii]
MSDYTSRLKHRRSADAQNDLPAAARNPRCPDSHDQLTRLLPLVGDAGAAALVLLVVFSRPASLPTDALRTAAVTPSLIEGFLSVGLAGSCTSLPFWKRARRSCQLFVTLDIAVDESSSIDADDIVEILVR